MATVSPNQSAGIFLSYLVYILRNKIIPFAQDLLPLRWTGLARLFLVGLWNSHPEQEHQMLYGPDHLWS